MKSQENQGFDASKFENTIIVKVTDPQADAVKGFYTYLVSGSDHFGTFQIRRRYNDFFYLREALLKKWPGIYVPPIPQKKFTGNKDIENIESRRKFFDFFLKKLSQIQHLFKSPITQQFLRNKSLDMQKFFQTISTPKYYELVQEYKKIFADIDFTTNQLDIKANIGSFNGYLKRAEKQLDGLKIQMQAIVEARHSFTEHLNNCNQSMLPEYQKNVYAEYLPEQEKKDAQLIFVNNHKVQDNIRSLRDVSVNNSFIVALDLVSFQILEVRAMQETLKTKQKYENDKKQKEEQLLKDEAQMAKLMGGKTTFKSFFSKGSKNEQIQKFQKQIPELKKQIESLTEFNNICTVIFGLNQMVKFKRRKQLQYYKMMYDVSENELKYLSTYGEFMKSIMQALGK